MISFKELSEFGGFKSVINFKELLSTLYIVEESREAKELAVDLLACILAISSREDVEDLIYAPEADKVFIVFSNGYERVVNIACDSVIAMCQDILKGVIY